MMGVSALLMVLLASEAEHLATLAMIVLAVVLAALVALFSLRGRRAGMLGPGAERAGVSCSSSAASGCCRR